MTAATYFIIFISFCVLLFTGVLFIILDQIFYGLVNLGRIIYEAIV